MNQTQNDKQNITNQQDSYGLISSLKNVNNKPLAVSQNVISSGKGKIKKIVFKKRQNCNYPVLTSSSNSINSKEVVNKLNNLSIRIDQVIQDTQTQAQTFKMKKTIEHFKNRQISFQQTEKQLKKIINSKNTQLQKLRIKKCQLNLIINNQQVNSDLQQIKDKVKIQIKSKDLCKRFVNSTQRLIKNIQLYDQYYNFLEQQINPHKDTIIHIKNDQQVKLLSNNLEEQINYLFHQLQNQQKKNSRQIKHLNQAIQNLRISIHQKQNALRQLKAKLCSLHIRSHRNILTTNKSIRQKSKSTKRVTLSIKKLNYQNKWDIQQAFIGNNHFKSYSKALGQKVSQDLNLQYLRFYVPKDIKEGVNFQCIYQQEQGKIHQPQQIQGKCQIKQQQKIHQVQIKSILSIKFFFRSKIVGVQLRIKDQIGNKHIQIGDCDPKIDHELLTLIKKRLITIYSYWHQNQMIGVSLWYKKDVKKLTYSHKQGSSRKDLQRSSDQQDINSEYYN